MSQATTREHAERPRTLSRWALGVVVLVSALLVWFSSWDHELYSPDEGRYASVSVAMLDSGNWLVPTFRGHPHLTKPPMTYWAQAASMAALGKSEIAVRLPALLATSLSVLVLFGLGRAIGGGVLGAIAAGAYASMPLVWGMGRIANTDPLLNLFWLGALACGYLAAEQGRTNGQSGRRWTILLWIAISLGLITKGPVALTPVGVLLIWLGASRRWRDLRRLWIPVGLPVALVPLLVWVFLIWRLEPEAMSVWRREIVDRAVGTGDHNEPIWFFVPIYLVGMFPATAILLAPGWRRRARRALDAVRLGQGAALWILAIVGPMVMFSLISGKLATYILPTAAPSALLLAMLLKQRFSPGIPTDGGAGVSPVDADVAKSVHPPGVLKAHTIIMAIVGVGALGAAIVREPRFIMVATVLLIVPIASAIAWIFWRRLSVHRLGLLAGIWAAWMVSYTALATGEDLLRQRSQPKVLIHDAYEVADQQGVGPNRIAFVAFYEPCFGFYTHRDYPTVNSADDIAQFIAADPDSGVVLIADERTWDGWVSERYPQTVARFRVAKKSVRWVRRAVVILVLKDAPKAVEGAAQ